MERYNKEAMIPPKLGDAWIPKILITIGREKCHAMLDLGSSVCLLSKQLFNLLDLDEKMEKCDIDLLLANDSKKHALGRIDNIMIELHITLVPVDFVVMDMGSNSSSPIILGRPFFRTTGAIIDSKEGKCQISIPSQEVYGTFSKKEDYGTEVQVPCNTPKLSSP